MWSYFSGASPSRHDSAYHILPFSKCFLHEPANTLFQTIPVYANCLESFLWGLSLSTHSQHTRHEKRGELNCDEGRADGQDYTEVLTAGGMWSNRKGEEGGESHSPF